jgi:hypothetical protein
MVKGGTKAERLIEMTLYFNNEEGINGIPYTTTTPNGQSITYHMNGLRSLIAMFKLTPFLPLENHYLNDIIGIDAVSLVSMQISTVPGYPRCLAAVLTLQEFGYRSYMPELPIPDGDAGDDINKNMFSTTIAYEVMRWYYQQPIIKGEQLVDLDFSSQEYIDQTFGNKTALIPMDFEDSTISFYVPNQAQLEKQLETKIAAMSRTVASQPKLSDNASAYQKQLGSLLGLIETSKDSIVNNMNLMVGSSKSGGAYYQTINGKSVCLYYDEKAASDNAAASLQEYDSLPTDTKLFIADMSSPSKITYTGGQLLVKYADSMYQLAANKFRESSIFNHMDIDEIENKSQNSILWKFKIYLNRGTLSNEDEYNEFVEYMKQFYTDKNDPITNYWDYNNNMVSFAVAAQFSSMSNGKATSQFVFQSSKNLSLFPT